MKQKQYIAYIIQRGPGANKGWREVWGQHDRKQRGGSKREWNCWTHPLPGPLSYPRASREACGWPPSEKSGEEELSVPWGRSLGFIVAGSCREQETWDDRVSNM